MHDGQSLLWLIAGYGPEDETCVFELTYNYGKDKYDNFKGEGYAQVALSSEVRQACWSGLWQHACSSLGDRLLHQITSCSHMPNSIWPTSFLCNCNVLS